MKTMQPANIKEHLPLIERGLKAISHKSKYGTCQLEEVVEQCLQGKSFLFVNGSDFIVVHPTYPDTLFIILAYVEHKHCIDDYRAFVFNLANQINLSKISWRSPRKGWMKAVKHLQPIKENDRITIEVTHEW